ncbi:MAG: NAD(P)H-binding protein [Acidobacteria bacterium]|nr:NAD(P)H-binding protein [Acidobacteriota bacterium]
MNVVLYGASGNAGQRIYRELVARGHDVMAVVRKPENLVSGIKSKQDDLSNTDRIVEIVRGADAVISAYAPPDEDTDQLIEVTRRQIEAVRKAGVPRLIVVGGAGSLEVAPGLTMLASGQLPDQWVPIATSHSKALQLLESSDVNWTYFSPSAFFGPGERTGSYRLGTSIMIANENGESRVSMEDYAVALVNELENPVYERSRFTIGY